MKLEQINIIDNDDLIIRILEPIIYTKIGGIHKGEDVMEREKNNTFYQIAEVVKEPRTQNEDKRIHNGMHVMVSRHSYSPIQFPINGYDKPCLATLNRQAIFAILLQE